MNIANRAIVACAGKLFWENPGKISGNIVLWNYFKKPASTKKFPGIIFAEISSGLLLVVKGKIFLTSQFGSGAGRYSLFERVCENGSREAADRSTSVWGRHGDIKDRRCQPLAPPARHHHYTHSPPHVHTAQRHGGRSLDVWEGSTGGNTVKGKRTPVFGIDHSGPAHEMTCTPRNSLLRRRVTDG